MDDDLTNRDLEYCTAQIRRFGMIYLSVLLVPSGIIVLLVREYCKAVQGVNRQRAGASGSGDPDQTNRPNGDVDGGIREGSVAAFASSRVLKSIVHPMKWYPIVFLVTSVAYLLWTLSMPAKKELNSGQFICVLFSVVRRLCF